MSESLRRFTRGLEQLHKLDSTMQLSTALTLLYPALYEGITQKKIEELLDLTNASSSRNVAFWTKYKRQADNTRGDKKVIFDFLSNDQDPKDRRYRTVGLTPKGQAFITGLTAILER